MHITVYLGASCGTDPHLAQAVRELGAWIGAAGHTLVYGGSKTGLMGLLAQSALAQGAGVIGVEPELLHGAGPAARRPDPTHRSPEAWRSVRAE